MPFFESSAATSAQASALRDEMYTAAPASTNPSAIIRPMPRVPPVTSAVLPAMEKRSEALMATFWPTGPASDLRSSHAIALRTVTLAPTRSEGSSTEKVGQWCVPAGPVGGRTAHEEVAAR